MAKATRRRSRAAPYSSKLTRAGAAWRQLAADFQRWSKGRKTVRHETAVRGARLSSPTKPPARGEVLDAADRVPETLWALQIGNALTRDGFPNPDDALAVARQIADAYDMRVKVVGKKTRRIYREVGSGRKGARSFMANPGRPDPAKVARRAERAVKRGVTATKKVLRSGGSSFYGDVKQVAAAVLDEPKTVRSRTKRAPKKR